VTLYFPEGLVFETVDKMGYVHWKRENEQDEREPVKESVLPQ
jgi:hypothetical protein